MNTSSIFANAFWNGMRYGKQKFVNIKFIFQYFCLINDNFIFAGFCYINYYMEHQNHLGVSLRNVQVQKMCHFVQTV